MPLARRIAKFLALAVALSSCQGVEAKRKDAKGRLDSVVRVECRLSAFGVESDNFPSITGRIDFVTGENTFEKTFYDPKHQGSSYTLGPNELNALRAELESLKLPSRSTKYRSEAVDVPSSTLRIRTPDATYEIEDYGLAGSEALRRIYGRLYRTTP